MVEHDEQATDNVVMKASKNVWKLMIAVAGLLLVVAGVVMLVLPGPGLVVLFLGLAVLATEFKWARRLLERLKGRMKSGSDRVKETLRRDRGDR
jgi:uncharacterized protein (TIGR02611 family)